MGITFAGSANTNPIEVTTIYYNGSSKVYIDSSTFPSNTTTMVMPVDMVPANSKYELEISV